MMMYSLLPILQGDKGYYSSAKEGGFGEKDIYVVELKSLLLQELQC
jgi:hypothetical protein